MSDASRPLGRPLDAEELLAHAAWLRGLARSLVADDQTADDVVQETFAAAVSRPPRERGALRGWLAKVARHAAWKSRRGDARRTAREQAAPRRGAQPSAADTVVRLETQRALLDAVQALDEPYRAVVMMRFYDGKAPREIARELGVAPEVVWQRLSRAIAMLRARLDARRGGRDEWAGVFVLWLNGGEAVTTGSAAALGTGAALMGTKAIAAATVAVGLAVWFLWPRVETNSRGTASAPQATLDDAPAAAPKPTTAARTQRPAEPVATDAAPSVQAARARIRGRVVDAETGEPIGGAHVYVVRKSRNGGFVWRTDTGGDGRFADEVAEAPTYAPSIPWSQLTAELTLSVSAPGHLQLTVNSQSRPGFETTGEDLGDLRLERGRVVRGRVVTAEGRPVPRAELFVSRGAAFPGYGDQLDSMRRSATADDVGVFQLAEALQPTEDANVYTVMAVGREGVAFTTLPVREGREVVEGIVLTVHAAVATVFVSGPDGRPVADAEVVALPYFGPFGRSRSAEGKLPPVSAEPTLAAVFTRRTGTDGRARFDSLPTAAEATVYDFGAIAPGCAAEWRADTPVGSGADAEINIALQAAQPLVAGLRVVDAGGRPIRGVRVGPATGAGATGVTDADGVVVLGRTTGSPGGTFVRVQLTKDGLVTHGDRPVEFTIDDGRPLPEIVMEPPAPVAGRIVDQDDRPVAGAQVALTRERGSLWAALGNSRTGADGVFSFPDATAGEWTLLVLPTAGTDGFVQPPDTIVAGGSRDVVVRVRRLEPARANVVVDVVDATSGAPVDALDANFHDVHPARGVVVPLPKPHIDAGRVSVGPLRPGEYALWLRVADRPNQLVRLHVAEVDTDIRATCRVSRGVAISGRIRVPEGYEGELPRVSYQPHEATSVPGSGRWPMTSQGWMQTAADGSFRVEGVTPLVYRVSAGRKGWYSEPVIVDATAGDVTAEVVVRRGALLHLRGSGPVEAVCVWIEGSRDGGPWFVVDQAAVEDGRFEDTETLPPGTLRWRAVFRRSFMSHDVADAAEPQSGEVLLEAGKDVELVIPVVPKR